MLLVRRIACILLMCVCAGSVWAQSVPPVVAGSAFAVEDLQSGQLLAQNGLHERVEPGALVKLMTAYLAFQSVHSGKLSLQQPLTVSSRGWQAQGTRIFMQPKTAIPAQTVLRGMLVASGNDAAITVAETVGGSETGFVKMMNAEAQKLGMMDTHYVNCTGVSAENQYTTVADLLVLTRSLLRDFPQYASWFAQRSFSYNGISQPNRNLLLFRDASVNGMAVGYTLNGGYNLIASSQRNGRRVLALVMGTESQEARAAEGSKLLNWGLQAFDTVKLYDAKDAMTHVTVYQGARRRVPVGFLQTAYVTVPAGMAGQIKPVLETVQPVVAPVRKGQNLGSLKLYDGTRLVAEKPVVALADVGEAGWFGRAWDGLVMRIRALFS